MISSNDTAAAVVTWVGIAVIKFRTGRAAPMFITFTCRPIFRQHTGTVKTAVYIITRLFFRLNAIRQSQIEIGVSPTRNLITAPIFSTGQNSFNAIRKRIFYTFPFSIFQAKFQNFVFTRTAIICANLTKVAVSIFRARCYGAYTLAVS